MNANVGDVDRTIRFTLGLFIILIGVYLQSYWGLVGVILITTAALGWCPLYMPFRISSVRQPH